MNLEILSLDLLPQFIKALNYSPKDILNQLEKTETPVDYFQFYNSVSSVYSSKIEGENIDFDSFFKHKFMNVQYQPDYTKKADDLYLAYEFVTKNKLTLSNLQIAHSLLSANLLPINQQGLIRNNPMFVINSNDRIEYVAAEPSIVKTELEKLFKDIQIIKESKLNEFEVFYFASYIHLAFVKIHPFQDGNGRAARLLEKWFLIEILGEKATVVQLEKNYYQNLETYYSNIKKLGTEYQDLDFSKCLDFLLMTVNGMQKQLHST
jgi:Fic family protein